MYGLIGNPLGHSFSATFFNNKFEKEGIDECYRLFPLADIADLEKLLSENGTVLKGLNVTIPYKQSVIPLLTEIDEEAKAIGAVNTIRIREGGKKLVGYNTDAEGFRLSILPLLKPYMKRALVLGTGGASKAIEYVLEKAGLEVTKVSRHPRQGQLSYDELTPDIIGTHHVIVNTTPLGTWPACEKCPDIPYHMLTDKHVCHDLVYNPEVTEFMKRSAARGATVKNGLEMLHGQALAAWQIWNR